MHANPKNIKIERIEMAYYQQPTPQQMQQSQEVVQGSTNYLCCANPFDDFFGSPAPGTQSSQTIAPHQKAVQTQDWNSPFNNGYAPYSATEEGRSIEDDNKSREVSDVRSVGSRGTHDTRSSYDTYGSYGTRSSRYSAASSNLHGKSLQDIERENYARHRAMQMQESLVNSGSMAEAEETSVLATGKAASKLKRRHTMMKQPEVKAKSAAVNTAVKMLQKLRIDKKKRDMTETTRKKKELTPEDVRDPETIPGMRSKVDAEKEEEAKTKAFQMISNGEYRFDVNNTVAYFSDSGRAVTRKDKGKVEAIV